MTGFDAETLKRMLVGMDTNALGELQLINRLVANRLFPSRTDSTMYLKLYGEVAELVEGSDPGEVADIFIMMLDYADRYQIDIGEAVRDKLIINLNRKWVIDPITGVAQHAGESYVGE